MSDDELSLVFVLSDFVPLLLALLCVAELVLLSLLLLLLSAAAGWLV